MLHLNTIDEITHQTLLSLQSNKYLESFALVGGTNLSLRYGYRKSIDLDFFSTEIFDPTLVSDFLQAEFPYAYRSNNKYMLFCYINNIKVDFVYHPFDLLRPIEIIDGIRFFSVEDVSAMKLFALTKRGSKKDFFDVYALSQILGPVKLLENFSLKYGEDKIWMMKMSLVYFEDADNSEEPEILEKNLTWEKVKKYMLTTYSTPL